MGDLLPIDEVGRRLRLRASAIRYYEQRGLIGPTRRRAGKRWLDTEQIRRLAAILMWKERGRLTLQDITPFVGRSGEADAWGTAIDTQISALTAQIDELHAAREFLRHVRHHHPTDTPEGCPHYEELLRLRLAEQ